MVEYIQTPQTRLSGSTKGCLKYNRISNCITEIPQDIKLELQDGVLTLKAGSKVYIPNGFEADGVTKKFDVKIIDSDIVSTGTVANDSLSRLIYYNKITNTIGFFLYSKSGNTAPTEAGNMVLYNTDTNTIRLYQNGTLIGNIYSLPLGLIKATGTNTNGTLEQVFNGLGYVGSVVYALPGLKGLIPDGFNEDGSLRSIPFTISNVMTTHSMTGTAYNRNICYNLDSTSLDYMTNYIEVDTVDDGNNFCYIRDLNKIYEKPVSKFVNRCNLGVFSLINDKITTFRPKVTYNSLDYNSSQYISYQSYPSHKWIDLTLGASGSEYTAPASGWYVLNKVGNEGQYIQLRNKNNYLDSIIHLKTESGYSTGTISIIMPVAKLDIVQVFYTCSGATNRFRFVYSNGDL